MKKVATVVLDEADEMFGPGFHEDFELILDTAPSDGLADFFFELFLNSKPAPISALHRDEG